MRIAVISTLASGGAASAAWCLTNALSEYGHDCSFFILESSDNPRQIPLLGNENAFWLPASFKHWLSLTDPGALASHATELFSDNLMSLHVSHDLPEFIQEAEVVNLHWVAGMLFSPALLSAIAGKKIVWTLHDENAFTGGCHYAGICQKYKSQCCDCPLLKKSGLDDLSSRCFELKKRLYPFLDAFFVTPSVWLAEEAKTSVLLRNYPVTTIPNPLDIKRFLPLQNKLDLRRKLGLPEDAFLILSGSAFLDNPRKNVKVLFDALELLSGDSPALPIELMLYGYGKPPELAFIIHHFGYVVDEAAMAELYGVADLLIHTSLQENLALTLCEAQACGTPTLCFDVGGCSETMLPEKTGFLVTEMTCQALAEKLRAIIADRNSLVGMREAAHAFAFERFSPITIAATYTEVFEKAQPAPGLKTSDPLFTELLQNQIASLATLIQENDKEIDDRVNSVNSRIGEIEASTKQLDNRIGEIEAYIPRFENLVNGVNSRIGEIEAHVPRLENRINEIETCITKFGSKIDEIKTQAEEQTKSLEQLRWNLRHPFRWFFNKFLKLIF